MPAFHVIGVLTTLAAVFAYINYRFLKLPVTIGLMLQSLMLSLLLLVPIYFGVDMRAPLQALLGRHQLQRTSSRRNAQFPPVCRELFS